jgi:hypothetical protein
MYIYISFFFLLQLSHKLLLVNTSGNEAKCNSIRTHNIPNIYPYEQCDLTASGAQCEVTCDSGYFHSGSMVSATCFQGTWTNLANIQCEDSCSVVNCENGGTCMNGMSTLYHTFFFSTSYSFAHIHTHAIRRTMLLYSEFLWSVLFPSLRRLLCLGQQLDWFHYWGILRLTW